MAITSIAVGDGQIIFCPTFSVYFVFTIPWVNTTSSKQVLIDIIIFRILNLYSDYDLSKSISLRHSLFHSLLPEREKKEMLIDGQIDRQT